SNKSASSITESFGAVTDDACSFSPSAFMNRFRCNPEPVRTLSTCRSEPFHAFTSARTRPSLSIVALLTVSAISLFILCSIAGSNLIARYLLFLISESYLPGAQVYVVELCPSDELAELAESSQPVALVAPTSLLNRKSDTGEHRCHNQDFRVPLPQ